jgi:hypothetical protein
MSNEVDAKDRRIYRQDARIYRFCVRERDPFNSEASADAIGTAYGTDEESIG